MIQTPGVMHETEDDSFSAEVGRAFTLLPVSHCLPNCKLLLWLLLLGSLLDVTRQSLGMHGCVQVVLRPTLQEDPLCRCVLPGMKAGLVPPTPTQLPPKPRSRAQNLSYILTAGAYEGTGPEDPKLKHLHATGQQWDTQEKT